MLNILGTAVALASCIVIFLVLQHEYSYDTWHHNASHIYQVVKKASGPNGDQYEAGVPFVATKALRNDYPQIKFAQLFTSYGSQVAAVSEGGATGNKRFIEERGVFFAEPEIFQLFDAKWLIGSAAVLKDENTSVLSQTMAEKYFGNYQDAVGKYIKLDNNITARVSGIIGDVPANSDFPFKVVLSYKTLLANTAVYGFSDMDNWRWDVTNHQVYALLPDNVDPKRIDQSFKPFIAKYAKDKDTYSKTWFLNPLAAIHFDTRFDNNGDHVSSKTSLYTLSFIGVLILLMACINFINLSTALAVKRSKEVGVRKVMGSNRLQLRLQVYIETGLIVLMSSAIAMLIAWYSLPFLKHISVASERLDLFNPGSIAFIGIIMVLTTLLSGSYPSLVLSRFNPIDAIKNKITTSRIGGISLRRVLVVLQFSFSQLLIIATIIAIGQMNYIHNADLGFSKEAILLLNGNTDSSSLARQNSFKNELKSLPDVSSVSFGWSPPASPNDWQANFAFDKIATEKDFKAEVKYGDADYFKTFGLRLAAGRYYNNDDTAGEVVVNKTMVTRLGLKDQEEALGKSIRLGTGRWRSIIGVVEDFKANSLKTAIPPIIILQRKQFYGLTAIKLNSNNLGRSNEAIETIWNKYFPEYAYSSQFFDDAINNFYRQEQQLSTLYKVYAGLAILISCLGLYGLVSFMAVQKTKEIGVRKVLGASIGNILYLFSKEFTVLILIAFALAAPAAWYLMSVWLRDFVYRIHPGPGVFLLAVFISIVLAWITVGYRSLRAAMANPVKSLRAE